MATRSASSIKPKISDQAVKKATGKTWEQWLKVIDNAGGRQMNHKQIVAIVANGHGVGEWWQQMVTVGYEQARGLRDLHQKTGGYEISGSKTVDVPVAELFNAWNDPKIRRKWLGEDSALTIRKATRPKSLRITWVDKRTSVDVNLYPKGDHRSHVSLKHGKLRDAKEAAKMKKYWALRLERLKAFLSA